MDIRTPASPGTIPVHSCAAHRRLRRRGRRVAPLVPMDRHIAVIGLGYGGLPLALSFIEAGLAVQGIDVSSVRVSGIRGGSSPIDDVTDGRLSAGLAAGLRVVTPDAADLRAADVIVVCVPTAVTVDNEPDPGAIQAAARTIAASLRTGHLVILQSTSYPGTTTGLFRALLEANGLRAGVDFDLAFVPDRVNPGDPASAGRTIPRLVGGSTPDATHRAATLLRLISDQVVEVSSPEAAEMATLLENTFWSVNIALVNEVALLCDRMDLDTWEVIDAAATESGMVARLVEMGGERLAGDLPGLVRWSDVVVVITKHRAIDWGLVYADAELVVDTVDSSRGYPVLPGQVLRLGAGWSVRP